MNKAVIFDMDGVLVDSEPVWHHTIMEYVTEHNIPLTLERLTQSMGTRFDLAIEEWQQELGFTTPTTAQMIVDIKQRMVDAFQDPSILMQGARESIQAVKEYGYPVAIASSSPMVLIESIVTALNAKEDIGVTHSAEYETHGKPAPDVYITTAKMLGVPEENCIAIEDSLNGMRSARAANMKVIAIPDERYTSKDSVGDLADIVLDSLEEINKELLDSLIN